MIKLIEQYRALALKGLNLSSDYRSLWDAELAALDEQAKAITAVGTVVVKDGQDPQICDEKTVLPNVSNIHKMPNGTVLYALKE